MLHLDRRILSELRIIAVVYWAFQEDEAFEVICDIVYGGSDLSKMDRGGRIPTREASRSSTSTGLTSLRLEQKEVARQALAALSTQIDISRGIRAMMSLDLPSN